RLYTARFRPRVDPFPTGHWVPARVGRGSLADSPRQTQQVRRTSSGADVPGRSPSLDARLLARSWERNARIRALGSQPPPYGPWVPRGPDKRYAESGSPFCDSLLDARKEVNIAVGVGRRKPHRPFE